MQILPSYEYSGQGPNDSTIGFASAQEQGAGSFGDVLHSYQETVQNAASDARTAADDVGKRASNGIRRVKKQFEDGSVPDPMDQGKDKGIDPKELKISPEEFSKLRSSLKKYGLSDDEMSELEEKLESDNGLDWGQLVQFLQQRTELSSDDVSIPISPTQRSSLLSMFRKAGFDTNESDKLLDKVSKGQFEDVIASLQQKLTGMGTDETADIDPESIRTLGELMNLPDEQMTRITKILDNAGDFTAGQAKSALALLQQGAAQLSKSRKDAFSDLRNKIAESVQDAVNREALLQDSDTKKVVDATRDKKAHEAFNRIGANSAAQESAAQQGKEALENGKNFPAKDAENAVHNASGTNVNENKDTQVNLKNPMDKGLGEDRQGRGQSRFEFQDHSGKDLADNGHDQDKSSGKDWSGFWQGFSEQMEGTGKEVLANVKGATTTAQANTGNTQQAAQSARTSMFEQVERGLLENLGDGKKRFTIKLNPVELGSINVILQTKGDELTATIRTENREVTRMVAEQLAQIKESLEQQGLKVSELEVKTGLSEDHQALNWQGTDQHNLRQQHEAMSQTRARMQRLRNATDGGPVVAASEDAASAARRSVSNATISIVA